MGPRVGRSLGILLVTVPRACGRLPLLYTKAPPPPSPPFFLLPQWYMHGGGLSLLLTWSRQFCPCGGVVRPGPRLRRSIFVLSVLDAAALQKPCSWSRFGLQLPT